MEVTRVTRDAKRQLKTGWWYTYPSEKMMEFKSVGMIKFPTELKVIIQMFQSPPTRHCLAGSQAAKRHLAMELSLGKKT